MNSRLSIAFWAKILATGAILGIVLARVDLANVANALSRARMPLFLLALSISFPVGFTGVQRWRSVAATFGESLPLSKAFVYAWIGQFINLGLPSLLGLDSVRAWKMHQQGISIGLAARIVVVDRLYSLATLLFLIALGIPHLARLEGNPIFKHVAVIALMLGSLALGCLLMVQLCERLIPKASSARRLYQLSKDFNHALFGNALSTLQIASWSILNHLCRVAMVVCLALALSVSITPIDAFALVPSALLIAMVPISLAGWGVREAVFIQALSLAGVSATHALAVSLLYGFVGLITGMIGGCIWFAERRLQKLPIKSSSSERHA